VQRKLTPTTVTLHRGLIDMMDHSGAVLLKGADAENKLREAVTTVIDGEGGTPVPADEIATFFDRLQRVSRARLYLARQGYWLGSAPIYGFRRLAVDELGVPQKILGWRERKALSNHRIRTLPGPEEEKKAVRAIFNLYVHHKWSISKIVRLLRGHGLSDNFERPWVKSLLKGSAQ
jgi:hypothetical protein